MRVILYYKLWNNLILDTVLILNIPAHLFTQQILNVCYLLGMVLATGTINKSHQNPCPHGGYSRDDKQVNN